MQQSDIKARAISAHRKVQSSTAPNRKMMQRTSIGGIVQNPVTQQRVVLTQRIQPTPTVRRVGQVVPTTAMQTARPVVQTQQTATPQAVNKVATEKAQGFSPAVMDKMAAVNARMQARTAEPVAGEKLTAKEIKDQAITKALKKASKEEGLELKSKKSSGMHFGWGRILLALSCATAAVVAIVALVNLNAPDIQMKVAAMQTGIEASYPSYTPRDFSLSDITSEDGKVILNFHNTSTGDAYSLIEEKSSWDSNALLSNYIKPTLGENFSVVREQGLTLYIGDRDAAWVNAGIVFKLKITSGSLTKKQIKGIATSL